VCVFGRFPKKATSAGFDSGGVLEIKRSSWLGGWRRLNERPRKMLERHTPAERFSVYGASTG